MTKSLSTPLTIALVAVVLLAGGLGYSGYRWYQTYGTLTESEQSRSELQKAYDALTADYQLLQEAFTAEKTRNDDFAKQINDIGGTVGKLDKLSRTDPELLQKYSKVFFLNENYAPESFEQVPEKWVSGEADEYISKPVWPFLKDMLEDAEDDGVNLQVVSAFRSFATQKNLKATYLVRYGSGANTFSADQGYSEHQLGTTIDLSTKELDGVLSGFDSTDAYAWLTDNAYKYGFILSYPHNNTYYQYEPWHWRFVGRELARDLHNDDKHFYDLDQREIDPYLVSIFD